MEKIKVYVPMMALCSLFIKCLATQFSPENVAALLILSALFAAIEIKTDKKTSESLKTEMEQLKSQISALEKKSEELKTHVSGLKIGQQMRPQQYR